MGRDTDSIGWQSIWVSFNPRARMGRDGLTGKQWRAKICFNPRARMGRDDEFYLAEDFL